MRVRRNSRLSRLFAAGLLTALAAASAGPAHAQKAPKPGPGLKLPPSESKGRGGTYQMHTKRAGNDYYVCIPRSYSDDNPAGLHLFFHGQNGQGGAPHFGRWSKYFLDRFNLIGINMQYQDGDNTKDPEGKVESAWEAVAQTIADYKVVEGRGVISSFSGGGVPHGIIQQTHGNGGPPPGPLWPFCHAAPYSSNFRTTISRSPPMSWFVSVGKGEWTMAGLGETQTSRMADLLREISRGSCPDAYCWITKKGHTIEDAEVALSAEGFRRSDLAFAPFLYAPDYPERELASIVRDANGQGLGRAVKAVARLLSGGRLDEALKAKASKLQERLAARVQVVAGLAKELAAEDPVLCEYYGRILLKQLGDLPEAREVRDHMSEARRRKEYVPTLGFPALFDKHFKAFFKSDGSLNPETRPVLEGVKKVAPPKSQMGAMAGQYLDLE